MEWLVDYKLKLLPTPISNTNCLKLIAKVSNCIEDSSIELYNSIELYEKYKKIEFQIIQ